MTTRAAKSSQAAAAARGRAAADKTIHAGGRLKLVPASPEAQLAEWIDELGALEAELVQFRPKLTRIETLRGLIRERFDGKPADKSFESRGARYVAALEPRAYERAADWPGLCKEIGLKAYAAIAKPTLKAAEKAVAPDVLAKYVKQDYTGARPLKTFPIDSGA